MQKKIFELELQLYKMKKKLEVEESKRAAKKTEISILKMEIATLKQINEKLNLKLMSQDDDRALSVSAEWFKQV